MNRTMRRGTERKRSFGASCHRGMGDRSMRAC
nr:MAG TPA: hypothetical protein [Caudoviricetes sp.]